MVSEDARAFNKMPRKSAPPVPPPLGWEFLSNGARDAIQRLIDLLNETLYDAGQREVVAAVAALTAALDASRREGYDEGREEA